MSTGGRSVPIDLSQEIGRLLRGGPRAASELVSALGVSQPTLSRTIRSMGDSVTSFRVSGDRTPLYGLLRQLPMGLSPRQPIFRHLSSGHVAPFAEVEFLAGGGTLERMDTPKGPVTRFYDGLPPYMLFAAPSGFLGRQLAQAAARENPFPASLSDWGDEHRVAYLFTEGINLPGNLIFGNASLQKEMAFRQQPPTRTEDKLEHYVSMANALRSASYGSSAGGEQPKFLWITEDAGHVLVKFAKMGTRMADLLPLEHLALRAVESVDVPAAQTQLLADGEFVFLEVQRFDRVGLQGRIGMLSAGAVDDEFFGMRDSWPQFAARCEKAKYLSAEDARRVDVMWAFSELIGNGDRHFENISVLIREDGEYQGIAPAYDILPMRYAPMGAGVDPELTPIAPTVGMVGAKPEVWARAAKAADQFWRSALMADFPAPLSRQMRDLAQTNMLAARAFAAPLLPPQG